MTTAHIDFETYSTVDLKKSGVHAYAEDPSTGVHCMAWAIDDEPVQLWLPGDPFPFELAEADIVMAHNAAFELNIWNVTTRRQGWPYLDPERVRCTMAMAYAMALPGSLENAAAAVGLEIRKDMEGRNVMLRLARPRSIKDGKEVWWTRETAPDKFERLYAYCRQDVEVERELEKRLLPLSDREQALWVLDQKINNRGIRVDLGAIDVALGVVEDSKKMMDAEMTKATGGWVTACSKLSDLITWLKLRGIDAEALGKADVLDLLDRDDLPAECRRALVLRQRAAKASTAKLKSMRDGASLDQRVRGTLQYHGANTGRWSGRRIQPQNFPRGSIKGLDLDAVFDLLTGGQ